MPKLDTYLMPVTIALFVFPILAFIFTFPFVYFEYRRHKNVPWVKALVIYSFIYYLLAVYFLVILPLPKRSDVAAGGYWQSMTLIPLIHVFEYFQKNGLTLRYFISFNFLQSIFNMMMLVPFGVYLRYYFRVSLKKTILFAFLFSLFLELTQLSGLYFIYPGPYRNFDVDDLFCNTLGGVVGWIIALKLLFFLPSREKLDELSSQGRINSIQIVWSLLIDFVVFAIPFVIIMLVVSILCPLFIDLFDFDGFFELWFFIFLLYCTIKSDSPGKKFCNVRIEVTDDHFSKNKCFIYRYVILMLELPGCKMLSNIIERYLPNVIILKPIWFLADLIPFIFVLRFIWHLIVNKREMLYERLSHTRIVSNLEV